MSSILFRNACILDVVAGSVLPEHDVLITNQRIKEISETRIKATDAYVLDIGGRVLMPGLCDAHVHTVSATSSFLELQTWSPFYAASRMIDVLKGMLFRGFTTVRDAGGADWASPPLLRKDMFWVRASSTVARRSPRPAATATCEDPGKILSSAFAALVSAESAMASLKSGGQCETRCARAPRKSSSCCREASLPHG